MHSKCNHVIEPPSWSSQSGSPSPPPPPVPPPVLTRWARAEQRMGGIEGGCPHCRGRLSVPTRTTSLSSYSCKGRCARDKRPKKRKRAFYYLRLACRSIKCLCVFCKEFENARWVIAAICMRNGIVTSCGRTKIKHFSIFFSSYSS